MLYIIAIIYYYVFYIIYAIIIIAIYLCYTKFNFKQSFLNNCTALGKTYARTVSTIP